MNLGERYKELRTSVKDESGNPISVKDFAAKCVNLQAPRISELENNKREMSLTELKAYHEYFNVSFEYLLGETNVKTVNDKIKAACEVTGLNEQALHHIATLSIITEILKVINSEEVVNNSDVDQEIKDAMTDLALKAYAVLVAMGVEREEFLQYLAQCSCIVSPIKIFEAFCNEGIFDKICLYVSFYASQVVNHKVNSKNTMLDDNFEDYTIWRLQKLISTEFKKIIDAFEIADERKEASENGKHNPTP